MKRIYLTEKQAQHIIDFYQQYPQFEISGENLSDYAHIKLDEAFDKIIHEYEENGYYGDLSKGELNEMEDLGDVMKSFDVQKKLNNKFWIDNKINSRVRLKLLDIADEFFKSLEVDWVKPKDIIMTGSLANYNWSKFSDIDLHIVVDFKEVDDKTDFVKDYFDSKKELWNEEHDKLRIYGFPVEVYVQDENEEHKSSGIYSLEKNEWIKEPERDELESIKLDKEKIIDKSLKYIKQINNLESDYKDEKDIAKLDKISDKVKSLFDKIKGGRKEGLKKGNEMSIGNIIFKVLRRTGYIGRLFDLKAATYDKINSIK